MTGEPDSSESISVFSSPGCFLGSQVRKRMLTMKEFDAAKLYVLLNCPEVEEYLDIFEAEVGDDISEDLLQIKTDKEFPAWLRKYILEHPEDAKAPRLKEIATNPYMQVNLYNGYFVNGYVFHTKAYGETRLTWNSSVYLKGNCEYYGVLKEVIELRYIGRKNVVLFNCDWRDSVRGIKKHEVFDLVDVKEASRHEGDDMFILASQAQQVYMTPYPNRRLESSRWLAVWKTKARRTIDISYQVDPTTESSLEGCYQEDEMPVAPIVSSVNHLLDDASYLARDDDEEEEILPFDLQPLLPEPGQLPLIETDEFEEEEDFIDLTSDEDNDDELEFSSNDSKSNDEEEDNKENDQEGDE